MLGLGDNIYQRAFIKALRAPVVLQTPWPQLYADLDIQCIPAQTKLRTQAKNVARGYTWSRPQKRMREQRLHYGRHNIVEGMRRCLRVQPGEFDLPPLGDSPVTGRYVVVRPATVRAEWRADTRNPRPEYIAEAAEAMQRRGYTMVSVADLQDGQEWALDPLPPADLQYHHGELPVEQLLALVQGAAAVIGGIGWLLPAAVAAKVPAWIIAGGQGGFNSPEMVTHPRMDLSRLTWAIPDRFCRCRLKQHACDKSITNHLQKFEDWADRIHL